MPRPSRVPVLHGPAELVHQRREEHRRVGGAAGDHHVGAACQRLGDRRRRRGRRWPRPAGCRARPPCRRLVQRVVAAAHGVEHVVAEHGGDLQARAARARARPPPPSRAAATGLAAPMLVTMRTPFAPARRQHGAHPRRRAAGRSPASGSRPFACWASAIVRSARHSKTRYWRPPLLGELHRGLDAVAGEAGAGADADRAHDGPPQSGLMLAARTSSRHLAMSPSRKRRNSAGGMPTGSSPCSTSFGRSSGSARAFDSAP